MAHPCQASFPIKTLFLKNVYLFFFYFYFKLGAQLINNVVLVSDVQQSDSVIPLHVPIFFKLFTHLDYCRILNGPPCALTAGPFIALF